jgi:hypothetical protein
MNINEMSRAVFTVPFRISACKVPLLAFILVQAWAVESEFMALAFLWEWGELRRYWEWGWRVFLVDGIEMLTAHRRTEG